MPTTQDLQEAVLLALLDRAAEGGSDVGQDLGRIAALADDPKAMASLTAPQKSLRGLVTKGPAAGIEQDKDGWWVVDYHTGEAPVGPYATRRMAEAKFSQLLGRGWPGKTPAGQWQGHTGKGNHMSNAKAVRTRDEAMAVADKARRALQLIGVTVGDRHLSGNSVEINILNDAGKLEKITDLGLKLRASYQDAGTMAWNFKSLAKALSTSSIATPAAKAYNTPANRLPKKKG